MESRRPILPAQMTRTAKPLTIAVVALAVVWLPGREVRPGRPREPTEPARWWVWPVLGLTLGLAALWSFLHQVSPMVDSLAHPSISSLVEPGLEHGVVRFLALWLWLRHPDEQTTEVAGVHVVASPAGFAVIGAF